ncbi:MAG: flagellar basal body-associated FliL family protein, partial [Zoogloeaceae bacterium]|nr:flagellar basal body-associated FliL family protein [Zoogloeaceae bacterium]
PENGENGFMQAEISLQVEGPEADDYLKSLMPRIRNDITLIMSDKQASDLASKEGKVKLAAEVRDAINLIAGPPWRNKDRPPEGPVIEVLFESIITQ